MQGIDRGATVRWADDRGKSFLRGKGGRFVFLGLFALTLGLSAAAASAAMPALPEGRVFERVSAADTLGEPAIQGAGGEVIPLNDDTVINGAGASPASEGQSGYNATYVSRRGAYGWETTSLLPSRIAGTDGYFLDDATADLSASVWAVGPTFTLSSVPPGFERPTLLRYRDVSGDYTTILEEPYEAPPPNVLGGTGFVYAGMSQDGRSVLFTSHKAPIGASNPGGLRRLWRWHPDGSSEMLAAEPGSPVADCSVEIAGGSSDVWSGNDVTTNAVSADGQTVFLQSAATPGVEGCPQNREALSQVYVDTGGRTELVSEPEGGPEKEQAYAIFRGATPDGRTAWIETEAPLTKEDHYVEPGTLNLYRWDAPVVGEGAKLTCLTCGPVGVADHSAVIDNTLSTSGRHLFFVKIVEEEGRPVPKLFVDAEGQVIEVPFPFDPVEPSLAFDSVNPAGNVAVIGYEGHLYLIKVGQGQAQVEPLATNAAGEPAAGFAGGIYGQYILRGALETAGLAGRANGAISDSGETIVFESAEVLAPGAEEARVLGVRQQPFANIYRWHDGEVAYMGRGGGSGGFQTGVSVSGDGHDIFFQSAEELVPNEQQTAGALYDARIGGGFPSRPAGSPPCAGEVACQGAVPAAPSVPASRSTAAATTSRGRSPSLTLVAPSASQLAGLARTGAIALRLKVAGGGLLQVSARARIDRHLVTAAAAKRKVGAKPATVTVRLRLSGMARQALREQGRLRLRLSASLPGAGGKTKNVTVTEGGSK